MPQFFNSVSSRHCAPILILYHPTTVPQFSNSISSHHCAPILQFCIIIPPLCPSSNSITSHHCTPILYHPTTVPQFYIIPPLCPNSISSHHCAPILHFYIIPPLCPIRNFEYFYVSHLRHAYLGYLEYALKITGA